MQRVVSLFLPTWSTDRIRRKLGSAVSPAEAAFELDLSTKRWRRFIWKSLPSP
jgi:protein ImuB